MEMEKVKRGNDKRIVTKNKVLYSDMPNGAYHLLERYLGRYGDYVICISYNGGGKLVNYGLNTFVRDIYMLDGHVAYSDRFGRYKYIGDSRVEQIIFSSNLFITSEGILLFYNKKTGDIYATLDCKAGYLLNISSFEKEGFAKENFLFDDITTINKNTYIKVVSESKEYSKYYLLNFSFNLYSSYGTQVELKAVVISESDMKLKFSEFFDHKIENDTTFPIIAKNDNVLDINISSKKIESFEDVSDYIKVDELLEDKEKVDISSLYIKKFENDREIGVNDCINAFVKNITISQPIVYISKGFFKKKIVSQCFKNTITRKDRFEKLYTITDVCNSVYEIIEKCDFFSVSLEGVIIVVRVIDYKDIHMLISLDGVIWKEYSIANISESIKEKLYNKSIYVRFSCKDDKNTLTILGKERNDDYLIHTSITRNTENTSDDDIKTICKFDIDFTFNFWDLYGSPVEAVFTLVE